MPYDPNNPWGDSPELELATGSDYSSGYDPADPWGDAAAEQAGAGEGLGLGQALGEGWDDMSLSMEMAGNLSGAIDSDTVADSIAKREASRRQAPEYVREYQERQAAAGERLSEAEGAWETTVGIADLANKTLFDKGLFYTTLQSAANSLPMVGGAVAGSVAGPVGTMAGGFTGSAAVEVGAKATEILRTMGVDMTDRDAVKTAIDSPEYRERAVREGLIKAAVISAVDVATFKVGGKILTQAGRKFEQDAAKIMADNGVDVTNKGAVQAFMAQPEKKALLEPAMESFNQANTLLKNAGKGAGAIGLEGVGEGVGEGLGEVASGGEFSPAEVAQEAASGLLLGGGIQTVAGGIEAIQNKPTIRKMMEDGQAISEQLAPDVSDAPDVTACLLYTSPSPRD